MDDRPTAKRDNLEDGGKDAHARFASAARQRYALVDGRRLEFQRLVPHIVESKPPIVECMSETGKILYATQTEWDEGAQHFRTAEETSSVVTAESSSAKKIALLKSLFRGRNDVYAHGYRRKDGGIGYAPACKNEWKRSICPKCIDPKSRCTNCISRTFLPLDDHALFEHIKGASDSFKDVVAVYPVDSEGLVSFLVADFDKRGWQDAVAAYRDTARSLGIDVAVERSRSGNGGHVWIFFDDPVEAKLARDLGSSIITEAMRKTGDISFDAYDRFFPSQDTVPKGGFGNAIALPFQGKARLRGNSVFVDDAFEPYRDQWLHLSGLRKVSRTLARSIANHVDSHPLGNLAGSNSPDRKQTGLNTQSQTPWGRRSGRNLGPTDFPAEVTITTADMVYIPIDGLSPAAVDAFKRVGAFANPEFHRRQAMHQSVYGTPRIVYLGETRGDSIALPRGCEGRIRTVLEDAGANFSIRDERFSGRALDIEFIGTLRDGQQKAARALLDHNDGILSAPTGFGKTVIGAYLIASIKLPTLVIVPKTALIAQWTEKLGSFLDIREKPEPILTPSGKPSRKKRSAIGVIGGGKNKPSGIVDVATFQSLVEKQPDGTESVKSVLDNYGLVICDECHHAAAPQLERVLKASIARKVYGLSATPSRADGLDRALFMLCGPIRCKISPKDQAQHQNFQRILVPRFTNVRLPKLEAGATFSQIVEELCRNKSRNALIVSDVAKALGEGKMPLVITKRKAHAHLIFESLKRTGSPARLLVGEGTMRQRKELLTEAIEASKHAPFAIVATESYLGEGFDMPRLDALFLATPVSWDGNVIQQSGRLHREHEGKRAVYVYDYVDTTVPMLERMYKRRLKAYASLGYATALDSSNEPTQESAFVGAKEFRKAILLDIVSATRSVSIFAPYASASFAESIAPALSQAVERGVRVVCSIDKVNPHSVVAEKSQNGESHREDDDFFQTATQKLQSIGCEVVFGANAPSGLAIFDETIVWYGSLPLLAFPRPEDCSLRFESPEIAHEILGNQAGDSTPAASQT